MTYQVLNPGRADEHSGPVHERRQLRRRVGLLARRRRHGQLADAQRVRVPGRNEHRARRDATSARLRRSCRRSTTPRSPTRPTTLASTPYQTGERVSRRRELADAVPRPRVVPDSEGGRAVQRDRPIEAERLDRTDRHDGRHATARRWPPNFTNATGTTTYNLIQPGTFYGPRVNTVDLRAAKVLNFGRYKATARRRSLQPLQLEHGPDVQPELRDRVELPGADDDPHAAIREIQRHCRFLITGRTRSGERTRRRSKRRDRGDRRVF